MPRIAMLSVPKPVLALMLGPVLASILALVLCVPMAHAQEDDGVAPASSDLARAQRDQSRLGTRITSLREKMERLAQRYDDEGRTRNATLLREALAEFDARQVLDVSRDLERNLSQSNLSSVEQQDALVASLEKVYSVLRDRRDADELQRQADLARKAVDELGFLAQNERRLLSRTRAATDQPGSLLKQALDLAQQLQQSLMSAGKATASTQSAEQSLGDSALADALASEQRALSEDPQASAETQAMLAQGLALLRERLEQPAAGENGEASPAVVGDELIAAAEAERDAARKSAAEAAAAMDAARERLQRSEGATSGKPSKPGPSSTKPTDNPPGDSKPTDGKPTDGKASDGKATDGKASDGKASDGKASDGKASDGKASDGKASDGKPTDGKPTDGKPTDGKPTDGKPTDGEPTDGDPSDAASADGEPSDGEPSEGAASEAKSGAAKPTDGAQAGQSPDGAAPEAPQSPEAAAAKQAMEEATAALEETRDALERSERSLSAARNRARALALASSAQAGTQADAMKDVAERLEAVEPDAGPELLDRTRQLLAELQKAAAALDQGENDAASAAQQSARTSLDDLIKQLQARAGENPDSTPRTPDATELAALAEQQKELQRQVTELMARLEELPDQEYKEASKRAESAMSEAESALREGRTDEAAVREEEAAEQLEKAQEKLSGERDKYEQLRQEEVLFRVAEELKTLLEKHDAVTAETLELDGGRGDAERLGRSQRRTVVRLSGEEKALSAQSETLRAALEKDGSVAFTFALERCRDDLQAAAAQLADEQTGFLVQSMQGDVHQRLVDLLAVLDAEQERRRNAKTEPPAEGQEAQESKTPLVPTVAELLLIQRMEQAALARLENFQRATPGLSEPDGLDPVERELLGRWALEHENVTELFRKMIPQGMGGPGADAPPAGTEKP